MNRSRDPRYLLVFLIVILALEAIFFSVGNLKIIKQEKIETEKIENLAKRLSEVPTGARAISVYDDTISRKIYGKDDGIAFPIASLAKIMTVTAGLKDRSLDEVVSISPDAISEAGDFGIFSGEEWKLEDLAKFTLIVSANDGAYAITENQKDILEEMNQKAERIGAFNTLFLNTTGLDIGEGTEIDPGAVASAEDMNMMALYALKAYPSIFEATVLPEIKMTSESGFEHVFKNTNIIIDKIPNLVFSKTGYTELAGGNLAIIFKNKEGHLLVVTLLGSTFDGRFADMEKLVEVLYNN